MEPVYHFVRHHPTQPVSHRKLFLALALPLLLGGCVSDPVVDTPSAPPLVGTKHQPAPPKPVQQPEPPPKPENVVIWERLHDSFALSIHDNRRIAFERNRLLKYPRYLQRVQQQAAPHLRLVLDEIEQRKLPGELALIPIMESGYRPDAGSTSGPAGLWQFMPGTGTLYGLDNNWWYDGRSDVVASTRAALDYLTRLNIRFDGDWELALAAYNAGDGTVAKAIKNSSLGGKGANYWNLKLPTVTQHYIPKIYALAQIFSNPEHYGLSLEPIPDKQQFAYVDTESRIDLGLAAKLAEVDLGTLKRLNPACHHWATNPNGNHGLLLPMEKAEIFKQRLSAVPHDKRFQINGHLVRKGETLPTIARTLGTQVDMLRSENGLKAKENVKPGQTLKVPTPFSQNDVQLIALNAIEKTTPTAAGDNQPDGAPTPVALAANNTHPLPAPEVPKQEPPPPSNVIAKQLFNLFPPAKPGSNALTDL